ncbi:hypothetical protein OESDEN_01933 [Oesophagostomum dentatum]|uniref:Uncharacterized protein n=1 Tax=Oesophagostomum dentatum TaxID=61180 RepID=A0A0B1TRT7_OESDE|nr:hypothetical protein OESDEN_01933 [Oesophagostomum dentatum]
MVLTWFLGVLFISSTYAAVRVRRQAALAVNQQDIPFTLSLLKPLNVPMIEDETEVGHHVGAVVDVTDRDGVVEFGERIKAFKAFRLNNGGITEWDRQGAGVDVGSRASAADDLVRLRWTLLGVNVGPNASRTLVGPGPTPLGRAKGAGESSPPISRKRPECSSLQRSLITCLPPGIRENLCFGPRVEFLKREKLGLTERRGAAYGYLDGVDIGLLKPLNIPMIEDETEVGHHVGAVVDVTDRDGVVEFGERIKAFKAFRLNNGGITEWDRQGAGVDVGSRASAADDLVRLRWTLLGVNVGPNASRTLVGPGPTPLGRARGAALKTGTPFPSFYRGYYNQGDWYRNQFYKQGNLKL